MWSPDFKAHSHPNSGITVQLLAVEHPGTADNLCSGLAGAQVLLMTRKERLQSRQILYLLASILLATALVTVIALNATYQLTSEDNSKRELTRLAKQINNNFTAELTSATKMLDTLSVNPSVLQMVQDRKPSGFSATSC